LKRVEDARPPVRENGAAGGQAGSVSTGGQSWAASTLRSLIGRFGQGAWLDAFFMPAVVAAMCVYLSLTSDVFLTPGNIDNVLSQSVLLAIVAFGATFVILAREIDLSVGAGVGLVSVIASLVMVNTHSLGLGVLAGLGVGLTIGVVNGLLVTLLEVPSFIATLGMLVILRGLSLALTNGGVIAGLPPGFDTMALGGFIGIKYIVWLTIGTFVVLYLVQTQTSLGIQVYAVGGNPEAARLSGVRVKLVKFICFLISGTTIALGGLALTARVQSGQPNGGQLLELYSIAAIVMGGTSLFGGRGSVVRTVFGVLLIIVLQNGLDLLSVNFDVQQAIIGTVFIAAASVDFVRRQIERRSSRQAARRAPPTSALDTLTRASDIDPQPAADSLKGGKT
jgi:ribose transport system permease protein